MFNPNYIRNLKKQVMKLYDPQKAFGNTTILRLLILIQGYEDWKNSTVECEGCVGTGQVDHYCNCDICNEQTEECGECFGEERVTN